jgi:hypothetical protein
MSLGEVTLSSRSDNKNEQPEGREGDQKDRSHIRKRTEPSGSDEVEADGAAGRHQCKAKYHHTALPESVVQRQPEDEPGYSVEPIEASADGQKHCAQCINRSRNAESGSWYPIETPIAHGSVFSLDVDDTLFRGHPRFSTDGIVRADPS